MPRRRHEEETPEELVAGLEEAPLEEPIEEEGESEEEEQAEEAPEEEAAAEEAAPPAVATKPRPPKRKPRRDIGQPHAKPGDQWKDVPPEGDQRWAVLIAYLKRQGKSPYDVVVRVLRADGKLVQLPGLIDGSAIMGGGNMSPGDALREAVATQYHEPVARGPMTYNVHFCWKATGQFITRGVFNFPSPEEMWAFRQAAVTAERQKSSMPRRELGAPPFDGGGYAGGRFPQEYGGAPPPPFYGSPPQAPQNGGGDEMAQMRAEMSRMREREQYQAGVIAELLRAQKEGRAPNFQGVAAPPPAAPPVQPQGFPSEGDLVERVANRLVEKLGLRPGMPGIDVGAPPPAVAQRNVVEQGKEGISALATMVGQLKELKGLGAQISSIFGEDDIGDEPSPPAAAPVVEPLKPEDDLPFQTIPIPESPTLLGQPYRYAVDKKTGGTSWEGILHSNPQIAEKAFEVGGKFLQGLSRFAKSIDVQAAERGMRAGTGQVQAQVVNEIPHDAADAGVAGTNGAPVGGGWPT
jgi:hypothetical protein